MSLWGGGGGMAGRPGWGCGGGREVCPVLWYMASTWKKMDMYEGWENHKVGSCKA